MTGSRSIVCTTLLLAAVASNADPKLDAMDWLSRMAGAARQLNYAGTFVYRHADRTETSRVRHLADELGEMEKLESLDGPVREMIRDRDEVWCYMPELKAIKVDRAQAKRFFPALIADPVKAFKQGYEIKVKGKDRVAGRDCQQIHLEPRDQFRYGYRLCADIESGLLLRANMVRGRDEVIEHFGFTEIRIGQLIIRDTLKSNFSTENWVRQSPPVAEESGWSVKALPPGFKKIVELKRTLANRPDRVTQLLYSDGLTAVSVFIEPRKGEPKATARPSRQGAVSFYSRQIRDYYVVAVGEVPPLAVEQIANSVAKDPPP
ncbi:MAG: MucB/RseB C-terminal domain-containing protein [Burkholderiales bacterium]